MHPILLSFGPIHIFSFSLFLILAWLSFSWVFWKVLRRNGIEEERIFDLSFYGTLASVLGSRIGFVLTHWDLFQDTALKIFALWLQPGLTLYGGWIAGILTLIYLARRYKVRLGLVLDALASALPVSLALGLLGSLLDGTTVGKMAALPWAIHYVGQIGTRHPIQLYELIVAVILIAAGLSWTRRSVQQKWPYGLVGILFFLGLSLTMFLLEFFKDSGVYWGILSANQWVLVLIFGEALGAFYVRGGGREKLLPLTGRLNSRLVKLKGEIYAKFSRRRTQSN